MNQILVTKYPKSYTYINLKKIFFKFQLIISFVVLLILLTYYIKKCYFDLKYEFFSHVLYENLRTISLYESSTLDEENSIYIATIKIDKIGIEYPIFNNFSYEALRIAPCRFHGDFTTNLCIVGHNYNDSRFFSKIPELNINDVIHLSDLKRK